MDNASIHHQYTPPWKIIRLLQQRSYFFLEEPKSSIKYRGVLSNVIVQFVCKSSILYLNYIGKFIFLWTLWTTIHSQLQYMVNLSYLYNQEYNVTLAYVLFCELDGQFQLQYTVN